jgi:hypothetical protein
MKNQKNKIFSIVIVLMFAVSTLLFAVPNVKAATTMPTYSFVTALPNPVGVGQHALITAFLDRYPPAGPNYVPPYYVLWDFTVTITDPSGNVQTQKLKSDAIGAQHMDLVPDKVGTWTIKMHFEGVTVSNITTTYLPSDSKAFSLIVQQEPSQSLPITPLPTGYWQRPIESENREWASIAGNWLNIPMQIKGSGIEWNTGGMRINPWSKAPDSPHIVWTKPMAIGGLVGGPNDVGYYTGDSYERKVYDKIIMNGVLYQNIPLANTPTGTTTGSDSGSGFMAVDLRTGKELYRTQNGTINFGDLIRYDSLNQHGVIPFLWNTRLQVFDPFTGKWLYDFANVTSGSRVMDKNGNLLTYTLNYPQRTLILWNATKALLWEVPSTGSTIPGQGWRPVLGRTYNWNSGIEWNVTIQSLAANGVTGGNPSIVTFGLDDDVIIARFQGATNETYPTGYIVYIGYSMIDGHQMWVQTYTDPNQIETGQITTTGGFFAGGPGVFMAFKQETTNFHVYDDKTGKFLYATDPYTSAWGMYHMTMSENPGQVAYGKLYTISYDGKLHAYDFATGHLLWEALGFSSGTETPYGSWPTVMMAIADGKVYVTNGEHSPNQPMYKGYELYCVDANTGELLWKVANYAQSPIIADGYLVTVNGYDMQEYCFGKGISAVTVSASPKVAASGTSVLIEGTVTDQSPGQTCLGIPAAGTPAISDDSMGAWMEYLYMSKPQPTNATGVSVLLQAMKSDGNVIDIGRTTSDIMGHYEFAWNPDTADTYKILATFEGSKSYYSSSEQCGLLIGQAVNPLTANDVANQVVSQLPTQAPYPTAPSASEVAGQVMAQLPAVDNTLLYAVIAVVVIALLIGLANIALVMRKK